MLAAGEPLLDPFGRPTPLLQAYIAELFIALDGLEEPKHTNRLEPVKLQSWCHIESDFVGKDTGAETFSSPRQQLTTFYKACGLEYMSTPQGPALTQVGLLSLLTFNIRHDPDETYLLSSIASVTFRLKTHFVRHQFPLTANKGISKPLEARFMEAHTRQQQAAANRAAVVNLAREGAVEVAKCFCVLS